MTFFHKFQVPVLIFIFPLLNWQILEIKIQCLITGRSFCFIKVPTKMLNYLIANECSCHLTAKMCCLLISRYLSALEFELHYQWTLPSHHFMECDNSLPGTQLYIWNDWPQTKPHKKTTEKHHLLGYKRCWSGHDLWSFPLWSGEGACFRKV